MEMPPGTVKDVLGRHFDKPDDEFEDYDDETSALWLATTMKHARMPTRHVADTNFDGLEVIG